jgi:hypothetical protein
VVHDEDGDEITKRLHVTMSRGCLKLVILKASLFHTGDFISLFFHEIWVESCSIHRDPKLALMPTFRLTQPLSSSSGRIG